MVDLFEEFGALNAVETDALTFTISLTSQPMQVYLTVVDSVSEKSSFLTAI